MEKLNTYRAQLQKPLLFRDEIETICGKLPKITHIRSLALGPPTSSLQAMYQLAFLLEVADLLLVDPSKISHWDPAFTKEDTELIEELGSTVAETYSPEGTILYFMPHAPLTMTETVILDEEPKYLLANNLISHTDCYTEKKLVDTHPVLGHLRKIVDAEPVDDGFTPAPLKKKLRKGFKPPPVSYDYSQYYFETVDMTPFKHNEEKNAPWQHSFSSLTYIHIIPKQNTADDEDSKMASKS